MPKRKINKLDDSSSEDELDYNKLDELEICRLIKEKPQIIKKIKNQTEAMAYIAVTKDGYMLEFVKSKTPEICFAALNNTSFALEFINQENIDVSRIGVDNYYPVIKTLQKEFYKQMCLIAVKDVRYNMDYIKDAEIIRYVIMNYPRAISRANQTEELCLLALRSSKHDAVVYLCIDDPSERINIEFVRNSREPSALNFVKNQTYNVCSAAIKHNGFAIFYVKDERLRFKLYNDNIEKMRENEKDKNFQREAYYGFRINKI